MFRTSLAASALSFAMLAAPAAVAAEIPVGIEIFEARSVDEFGEKGPVGSVEVGKYTYVEQLGEEDFHFDRVGVDGVLTVGVITDFGEPIDAVPPPLYLTFDIQHQGGLHTDQVFPGESYFYEGNQDSPFTGQIKISYGEYGGFGVFDGPVTTLATFDISPDWADVGESFSFNVYDLISGWPAGGTEFTFLMERVGPTPENTAWTFNNFRITKADQTTAVPNTAVPEPGTWALMILGFGSAGAMLRRRKVAVRAA